MLRVCVQAMAISNVKRKHRAILRAAEKTDQDVYGYNHRKHRTKAKRSGTRFYGKENCKKRTILLKIKEREARESCRRVNELSDF